MLVANASFEQGTNAPMETRSCPSEAGGCPKLAAKGSNRNHSASFIEPSNIEAKGNELTHIGYIKHEAERCATKALMQHGLDPAQRPTIIR